MFSFSQKLLFNYHSLCCALVHEPCIRPSFRDADIPTVIIVMFCKMNNGGITPDCLYAYMRDHDCNLSRATFDFFLEAYTGRDPRLHLWTVDKQGRYHSLTGALAAADYYAYSEDMLD